MAYLCRSCLENVSVWLVTTAQVNPLWLRLSQDSTRRLQVKCKLKVSRYRFVRRLTPENKIETVYQNLALVDQLDVAANFFLGREIVSKIGINIGYLSKKMRVQVAKELDRIGVKIPDLTAPVSQLSGGQRQGCVNQ